MLGLSTMASAAAGQVVSDFSGGRVRCCPPSDAVGKMIQGDLPEGKNM